MLLQSTMINSKALPHNRISFKGEKSDYKKIYEQMEQLSQVAREDIIQVKDTPKEAFTKKLCNTYKNAKKNYKTFLIGTLAALSFAGGYLTRPIIIKGENNKIEELKNDINLQQNKLDSINNKKEELIRKKYETLEKQDKMIRTLDSTYNAKLAEYQRTDSILNSKNNELSANEQNQASLKTEEYNKNKPTISTQNVKNVFDHTVIDKKEIAQLALKIFKRVREHCSLYAQPYRIYNEQLVFDGNKIIIAYKTKGLFNVNNMVTEVKINKDGDFSFNINGYDNDGDREFDNPHSLIVNGKRTPEGFYQVTWPKFDGSDWKNHTYLCDMNQNDINNSDVIKRKNEILHSKFQRTLDNIEDLNDMNKNMISALLLGNRIDRIDCVKDGNINIIYCDAQGANVEIRFLKKDAKTAYGVYTVTQDDTGSIVYAFKYTDQSTPNAQRINLRTKQVEQEEQFNSSVLNKRTQSIYEQFMCEGAIQATYTQKNDGYYKNGKKMF